ncbi:MAG: family 78 glycoside hydrolase catalytic domain [Leifsonia sp.]|uniref:family 78 glycoside hydrolase catalytic domain n=1 Tax=Leifsonia sp. TaxID=1870902 RepID=UPI003F7EA120
MTEIAPSGLRIDAGGDQFPVSGERPRLSWLPLDDADGYELAADIDGVGQPMAAVSSHRLNAWPWRDLTSGERVRWRVRGTGGAWSDEHVFEAGLFDRDWTAEWISPADADQQAYGKRPGHLFRRDVVIGQDVVSARLYSTALGVYEAFVNGERVGTAELSPGTTSYDTTVYAQAADVTAALRAGGNLLELVVTDGWYLGQVGAFHAPAAWGGDRVAARAELHLRLADGSTQVVRTDGDWTSWSSTIVRAGLMDGQATDSTVRPRPLGPVRVGVVAAPPVSWSPAPPVRRIEERAPRALNRLTSGAWIADFGQNASGWTRLTDLGPHGARTIVEHGEHLDPAGDLDMSHLDSEREGDGLVVLDQRDEVVSAGEPGAVFEPRHTIHGFQYARITREGAPLRAEDVRMVVVNTDLAPTGSFRCSDDDLNRLHEVAAWSFLGNAVDIPTDCPQRERLGWTGDYQVFASTAVRLFDVHGFTRKWLQSVRDDQLDDGRIANFSPDGRQVKHHPELQIAQMTGSAGWGDAAVHVPWVLYEAYGDRDELAANWGTMTRWVEWALETARTRRHPSRVQRSSEPLPHEEFLWDGSFHWGEWCEPKLRGADGELIDPVAADPMAWFMEDKGEIGTAFLHRSVSELARIARVLDRRADADRYDEVAGRVLEAWRTEFLRSDGRTAKDSQASYVRALSFGLIPQDLRAASAARLVELIRASGTHLGTGFLSTADLLPTLAETGHADVAYELLFRRTSPSWLGMLDRGATTIWEDWDGVDENGAAHESLNHYSKGAVVRFLHTHLLGLDQAPGSVAWESFVLRPVPGGGVTWAEGSHTTPQGTIEASWVIEDGRIVVKGRVPAATMGTVVLPDGTTVTVGAGAFRLSGAV